jgi:regulator of protease activity HflC (stomatin/prohibitin superfamily)
MKSKNVFGGFTFVVIFGVGLFAAYAVYNPLEMTASIVIGSGAFLLALLVSSAINIANPWDKAVVLRLGKFHSLQGPGLFLIVPILDTIPYWIDTRVIATSFKAEKTLTKDTVPVDVDAVLFWQVRDPKKTALEVADYLSAISWAAQTALRDVIGKTMLSDMLEGRNKISNTLQTIIDERTEPWGIHVNSVEVKDVLIPSALENAMSRTPPSSSYRAPPSKPWDWAVWQG